MPEIPAEALAAAIDAYPPDPSRSFEERMRLALEAAAPFIAAQTLIRERRRAVRLVQRKLVPAGCEPEQDAADLIEAIKGDRQMRAALESTRRDHSFRDFDDRSYARTREPHRRDGAGRLVEDGRVVVERAGEV